jgi:hypothetical protein
VLSALELLEEVLRQVVPVLEHVEMAEGHGHVLKDTLVPMELDLLLGALHAKERRGEAAGFELLALQLVRELEAMLLGADSTEGGGAAAAAAASSAASAAASSSAASSGPSSAASSGDTAWAADVRRTLDELFEAMPSLSAAQVRLG